MDEISVLCRVERRCRVGTEGSGNREGYEPRADRYAARQLERVPRLQGCESVRELADDGVRGRRRDGQPPLHVGGRHRVDAHRQCGAERRPLDDVLRSVPRQVGVFPARGRTEQGRPQPVVLGVRDVWRRDVPVELPGGQILEGTPPGPAAPQAVARDGRTRLARFVRTRRTCRIRPSAVSSPNCTTWTQWRTSRSW